MACTNIAYVVELVSVSFKAGFKTLTERTNIATLIIYKRYLSTSGLLSGEKMYLIHWLRLRLPGSLTML